MECIYCGDDIVAGQEVRRHHRGGLIHESCLQDHLQGKPVLAQFYAAHSETA